VLQRTPVLLLQTSPQAFLGGSEGAEEVVVVEGIYGEDGGVAVGTEGTGEFELEGGELDCEEGLAAAVGAAIAHVLRLGDAFDAEDLPAWPLATHQLCAQVETDPALEVLEGAVVFYVVFRVVDYPLHGGDCMEL
jgi:hypothetical protein